MFKILGDNDNEVLEMDGIIDIITEAINTVGGIREDIKDCITILEDMVENEVLVAIEGLEQLIDFHSVMNKESNLYKRIVEVENVYFQIEKISA